MTGQRFHTYVVRPSGTQLLVVITWSVARSQASVKVDPPPQDIRLPYPAVKCVIGQYIEFFTDRSWAWLIVGSFYDDNDVELWHIELFIRGNGPNTEQDTHQESHQESHSESEPAPTHDLGCNIDLLSSWSVRPYPVPRLALVSDNTMSTNIGRGWNPTAGWDSGSLPIGTGPVASHCYPPGYVAPNIPWDPYGWTMAAYGWNPVVGPPSSLGPVYTMPANGHQHPVPVFPGQPGGPRLPTAHPVVSNEAPALNMQNSTGGMGCEPGYNYYFPAEHTKIHVIRSRVPPWRLDPGSNVTFRAFHVPVNTRLDELMKGLGADNASAKKNRITEIVQGGNGRWYKGATFGGDDKDDMKREIKDVGWDVSRTGRSGEKPVVWIWVTKD